MTAAIFLSYFVNLREQMSYRDGVYVTLVAWEGLLAGSFANVPQFRASIARTGHEGTRVRRQGQRHHIAGVPDERCALLSGLNVP